MRQDITESGYVIKRQATAAVTVAQSTIDTKGETCYIQNVGASTAYIDVVTGVDSTKWEIAAGERTGPWTARTPGTVGTAATPAVASDTNFYLIGAGNTTLKFIFVRDV